MEGSFDTKNKGTFTWTDAWVLASVAVAGGLKGGELKDVIAAGDLINRATFTGDELRSGLSKLAGAGYVDHGGGFYVIAGDARAAVEELMEDGASSFSVMLPSRSIALCERQPRRSTSNRSRSRTHSAPTPSGP